MIRINDPHAIKLVAQFSNVQFVPAIHHCIAQYDSRDCLLGGTLLTDWNGGSIQVHVALFQHGGAFRPLIWLTFHYAFEQLKVKKMFGLVPEWNVAARNLDLHLGFKIEYLVGDVFAMPEDMPNGMYLMSMRKEDCRWLKMHPPTIEYAPKHLANSLIAMPTVGMMQ